MHSCERHFSFGILTIPFTIILVIMSFATHSKEAWVDEALVFANVLKTTQNSNPFHTNEEIQIALSKLPASQGLSAYQQLGFLYLSDWRVKEYHALKKLYSPILKQHNEDKYIDMQLVLNLFEAAITPGSLEQAITKLELLIENEALTDEVQVLAHVVNVYARNFKRNTPLTLKAIRGAKNAFALSKKSRFAELALELVSAFSALQVGDYAKSNESHRIAYENIQHFDYLYFNVENYLSNLSWMLRQSNELEHAIEINNWQLETLSENSQKQYAFFVYFACGLYQQMNGDYERSTECLFLAEKFLEYVPSRRESWYTVTIISLTMAERKEKAEKYLAQFMDDSSQAKDLNPLSKMHLATAYLDIKNGEATKAIEALNKYYVDNSNYQLDSQRKLSMQYNTYIDNEIVALDKNMTLQKQLLGQQKVLSGFGVAAIVCLVVFSAFLIISYKKQRFLATNDSLTGLFNRRGFLNALQAIFDKFKSNGTSFALGVLDIDGFKAINEVNGHLTGDDVLKSIALRIKTVLGNDAVIGRLGGDEFAFVLTNIENNADIMKTGMALSESLKREMHLSNINLTVSVSIGFSQYPDTANTIQKLIDCAEFALHSCKKFERGSVRLFSPADQTVLDDRRNIEAALANANDHEFAPYYQAIVNAQTEEVQGFEALARWSSPELGNVSPADFIPIAERTGHINKLSRILLTKALDDACAWPEHITLSFNLSSQDVNSVDNAEKIKKIVLASPFPNERLTAEMTETAIIQDTTTTREALSLLTSIGVSIALDDFGTGYSSINHLLDLDFNRIKLDRVLIDSIEHDSNKFEIVQALTNLCHNLNIDSVIEGIETDAQKEQLRKMKVDKFQGYLFSKPISSDQVLNLLAEDKKTTSDLEV